VNFTSTTSGGTGADTVLWTFGDGASSTLADPEHEYLTPGNYSVHLAVVDSLGRTANASLTVDVYLPLGATVESAQLTGIAPFTTTLIAATTGGDGPYTIAWNFGDGTAEGSGLAVSHVYLTPGTYTITVFVNDSLGYAAQAIAHASVLAPLSVKLASSVASGEAPEAVSFSLTSFAGGEAPYAFTWSFGDGATATGGSEANHTYTRSGSFTAKVSVSDGLDEVVSATIDLVVLPAVSVALLSGFGNVYANATDNLSVHASGGEAPYSYAWTGLPSSCSSENSASIACTPAVAGTSNVTVTVTDGLGRSAEVNGTLVVEIGSAQNPISSSGGGGSFPIWYAAVAFVIAAFAIALIAYWAGRRRSMTGQAPFSTPDARPVEASDTAPSDSYDPEGPPPSP